jgi:hypothetical protein
MDNFQKEVVLTAMRKMFQGLHFSICTVDNCLKITGAIPTKKDYDALSALHCVTWSEMSPQLRQTVLEKTVEILSSDSFNLSILELVFNESNKVFEIPKIKSKSLLSIFKREE